MLVKTTVGVAKAGRSANAKKRAKKRVILAPAIRLSSGKAFKIEQAVLAAAKESPRARNTSGETTVLLRGSSKDCVKGPSRVRTGSGK